MRVRCASMSVFTMVLTLLVLGSPAWAAAPPAPSSVAVKALDSRHFQVTWKDVSSESGYEVTNGVETKRVNSNITSYYWTVGPGTYMCFRVRSFSKSGTSAWVPDTGYVCATAPGMRFPWPKGTKATIAPKGLHGGNFGSIRDDVKGRTYTLKDQTSATALDIALEPKVRSSGVSAIPVTAVAVGRVLAVWKDCRVLLVNHGFGPAGPLWAEYLHMDSLTVKADDYVNAGDVLGRATNDPAKNQSCGNVRSAYQHVHFALVKPDGERTGTYDSLQGWELCDHEVHRRYGNDSNVILKGLTETPGQAFTVPC